MIIKNELAWGSILLASALVVMAAVSIQAGTLLVAFAIIAWWAWEYSEESLLLFIALSPLLPLLKVTQTLGQASLIKDVLIITLFMKVFLVPLFRKTLPYRKNTLFAPALALAAWAIFEALHAGASILSLLRLRDITLYMLLYIGVLYLPHTKKIMRTRFIWCALVLIITLTLGVFQMKFAPDSSVLRFDPVRQVWIPRVASTFAHPAVFAEFLVTAQMLLLGGIIVMGKKSKHTLILITSMFAVTLPFLYFTYTRASWIGFVVGISAIVIALIFSKRSLYKVTIKNSIALFLILLIVLFATLRFTHIGTFIQTAFDPSYASNADRLAFVNKLIVQTSPANALIGKGLGSSITQTNDDANSSSLDITSGASRTLQLTKDQTLVDNQYLKTFIEMGVVGIAFTLWLFWRFFRSALNAYRYGNTQTAKILGIAGIGFIAAFVAQALFVDIWDVYPTNAIFWIFAALISQEKLSYKNI